MILSSQDLAAHVSFIACLSWCHRVSPPTFAAFISLLDNYESDTGKPEIVTPEEVAENHKFLDLIIQTPTMKVPLVKAQFYKTTSKK